VVEMMALDVANMKLTLIICAVIAIIVYLRGLLTLTGTLAAFSLGMLIGIFGGFPWIFILLIFLITSFLSTKYKFSVKEKLGVQEGVKGERRTRNVLATGSVPTTIAVVYGLGMLTEKTAVTLYLTSIGVAASDTLASELGVLSPNTYLITNFKRVKPGTNGGISLYGEFWAFIASIYVAAMGLYILDILQGIGPTLWQFSIITAFGFIGCQIDSLLGATIEKRGLVGKHGVNFISSLATVIIMLVVLWAW